MTLLTKLSAAINKHPWHIQTLFFYLLFLLVTLLCAPRGLDFAGLTLNQFGEDFGVFALFLALWTGVYAFFRRTISIPELVVILCVALTVEELNLLNRMYVMVNELFDRAVPTAERQRGDVFTILAVAFALLVRSFSHSFRSVFRIFITTYLILYASFQLLIHVTFPYVMQQAMIDPQLKYQIEFTSTYPGRFSYVCENEPKHCYEWQGNYASDIDQRLKDYPTILAEVEGLVANHEGVLMNATGFIGTLPSADDDNVFIGVTPNRNYLLTFYRNGDLNRVVIDFEYLTHVGTVVSTPLVIFAGLFVTIWFFGGLAVVLMHQQGFKKSSEAPKRVFEKPTIN
jgi:hypothetical protein